MANRKQVYFTSDWHLFHENSIKFDNRPFRSVKHMHRVLINNYNACVGKDGVCYFLGDVGMGPSDEIKNILKKLNGTKVLVLGNHDRKHNTMYNIGFDVVINSCELYIAGERVVLSHCPMKGVKREDTTGMRGAVEGENWHGESRHRMFTVDKHDGFHLHGHLHAPNGGKSKVKDGKQWDIGIVGNDYMPVSISKVESWINQYKD